MKRFKLTKEEKRIERDVAKGLCRPVSPAQEKRFIAALAEWRKDAILHMRINNGVLQRLKEKAKAHGVPYQTFIAEILHYYAR